MGSAEIGARGFPLIGRFPRWMLSAQWTVAGACIKKCATVISGVRAHATGGATERATAGDPAPRRGIRPGWQGRPAARSRAAPTPGGPSPHGDYTGAPYTTTLPRQPPAALGGPEIGPHRLPQALPCHSHLHSIPASWTPCPPTTQPPPCPLWPP